MKRFYRAAVSSLGLLLVAAPGHAQSPPMPGPPPMSQAFPGFVSPYEVMRMVRASGFAPLAPPMRQGTTYVLRVTDFRGILMRVVVDGRTGAFREVSRIVPGPGRYGPPYGVPAYGPPEYDAAMAIPPEAEVEPPSARPAAVHPASIPVAPPAAAMEPPLPRPRPAALASRSPVDTKPAANQPAPSANGATKTEPAANPSASVSAPAVGTASPPAAPPNGTAAIAKPSGPPDGKPQVNSEVVTAPPPAAAAAKKSAVPVEPLND